MRKGWHVRLVLASLVCLGGLSLAASGPSQKTAKAPADTQDSPSSADEARERLIMDRFLTVLEKNPRRSRGDVNTTSDA